MENLQSGVARGFKQEQQNQYPKYYNFPQSKHAPQNKHLVAKHGAE
jgi:hypothetical protein